MNNLYENFVDASKSLRNAIIEHFKSEIKRRGDGAHIIIGYGLNGCIYEDMYIKDGILVVDIYLNATEKRTTIGFGNIGIDRVLDIAEWLKVDVRCF